MKHVSTLLDYMRKNNLKTADLAEMTHNTTNRINGWKKTAKPWLVSLIAGKHYAHPPGRMIDLEPEKGCAHLRIKDLEKENKKLQKEVDRLKRKQ